MRHCIRLTENEVKVLADALQFLSKSQQRNVERSHHTRCDELYLHLAKELGRLESEQQV